MVGSKPDEDIRTPLQWNGRANAGFTTGTPWRSPKPDYTDKNIEKQQQDYGSLWHSYRQIQLRNNHPALRKGNYATLSSDATSAAVFLRQFENEAIIVASNVSGTQINDLTITLNFSTLDAGNYQLVDLLTGTVHDIEISGNGGFTNQGIGSLAARSTALYKLMAPGNLDTDITFRVDMSEIIANNKFDPTSESVDMVSNLNDWGTTLTPLEGPGENNIYSLTLPAQAIGSTISYKYRLNGVSGGNEEYAHSDFMRRYLVQEGSNDILDVYQMDSPALGLADLATASFHTYPVPASGHVLIQLDSSIKGKASFTISDMSGKEIKGGMFNTSTDVSVDDLVSGIYILRVKVEGRSMSRKIIIENQ